MLITGEAFGSTTVVLSGTDGKPYVFEVNVELDLEKYNEALKSIDPQSNAKATSIMGNVVLVGTVTCAERARRIVELAELFLPPPTEGRPLTKVQNHLEVAGEQQVLLKCVVAEVSRAASRELGVNGFLAGENFKDGFLVNRQTSRPMREGPRGGAAVLAGRAEVAEPVVPEPDRREQAEADGVRVERVGTVAADAYAEDGLIQYGRGGDGGGGGAGGDGDPGVVLPGRGDGLDGGVGEGLESEGRGDDVHDGEDDDVLGGDRGESAGFDEGHVDEGGPAAVEVPGDGEGDGVEAAGGGRGDGDHGDGSGEVVEACRALGSGVRDYEFGRRHHGYLLGGNEATTAGLAE